MNSLGGFEFTINGITFYAGLFPTTLPNFPDIYCPILYQKINGAWVQVDKRDEIWKDLQEDIEPEFMMKLILDDFNKTIKQITGGAQEMTWIQKLARIFQEDLEVYQGALRIKP